MTSEIKICGEPLIDKRVDGKSYMCKMKVKEYLKLVSLDNNPYQREVLGKRYYKKLVLDLLNDTIMPPISLVTYSTKFDEEKKLDKNDKTFILDGLQRTNCLIECIKILEGKTIGLFEEFQKTLTLEQFENKEIYIEIWTGLSLKNLLYKMVVLNTGQQTMKYEHQLDILSNSLEVRLEQSKIKYVKGIVNKKNQFLLSNIVQALVSYINRGPISDKKNAAEFLFERLNLDSDEVNNELFLLNDERTYETLEWFFKEVNPLVDEKYGQEENPFRRYDVYLISFFGALGFANFKENSSQNVKEKKKLLLEKLVSDLDPLNIKTFEGVYAKFKTGIGAKRRKLIFEAFKDYFLSPSYNEVIEWSSTYDQYF